MRNLIALAVAATLGLAVHDAAAAPVTDIFSISASGFSDVIGGTTPPADPVSLTFRLTFDPATGDQFDDAAGLTLLSSSIALAGPVVFDYDSVDDILVLGAAGSSFSISAGTNDVVAEISSAYRGHATLDGVFYSTANTTGLYESVTGTVAVPEPASMLVVLGGLAGLGLTRRRN